MTRKPFSIRLLSHSIAMILAGVIAPVCAQSSKDETQASADAKSRDSKTSDTQTMGEVQVTATRRKESITEVPAFASVVRNPEKPAAMNLTVADVLRGQPGVFVQQTTPGQGNIQVRGLIGSEVLHLVDGFRVNNTIFRNAPNQYLALVDASTLGAVELIRGPASTLYGSDALGGAIQFISATPEFNDDGHHARARVAYASADARLQSRAQAGLQSERSQFWIGVSHLDVGKRRDVDGDQLPFTAFKQQGADLHARFELTENKQLAFDHTFAIQPKTNRYDALVAGFGQARPESATHQFEPQSRRFSHLRMIDEAPNALYDSAQFQIGQQVYHDDRRLRDTGSVNEDRERNTDRLTGFVSQMDKSLGESGEHRLSFGLERYHDKVESKRVRRNITTNALSDRVGRFPGGATVNTTAFYLVDDWKREGRFDINAGLRWSTFDIEIPAQNNSPAVDLDIDDITGHVGVNFRLPLEGWHLVSNLGRGVRAPNVFDLGTFGDRPSNRFNIPNSNLKPETIQNFDVGVKYETRNTVAQAALYRMDFKDRITSVETGERTESGRLIVQSRNLREADFVGLELGLTHQFQAPYRLETTLNWMRGDETANAIETPADRVPPLSGRIALTREFNNRWNATAEAVFAGKQDRLSQRDLTDARIDPNGTGGFGVLNLRTTYQWSDQLTIGGAIENLSNKKYREHGSGIDQAGRGVVLTFDWRM